jgi:hypothetical protein
MSPSRGWQEGTVGSRHRRADIIGNAGKFPRLNKRHAYRPADANAPDSRPPRGLQVKIAINGQ